LNETFRMWLPGHALNCYEGDPRLRSWLLEPGLLTARMQRECGAAYRLNVIDEQRDDSGFTRIIELLVSDVPWIYAETRVPAATLTAHPWLAQLGRKPLGEWLAARKDIVREELEYCRAYDDDPLVGRALARTKLAPQPLWVRQTRLAVGAAPFVLHEVFFPHTGAHAAAPALETDTGAACSL
jgi:chorismate-pyruvate lyase